MSYPEIDVNKCTKCGLCVKDCISSAIQTSDDKLVVNNNRCIRCSHCSAICPVEAVSFSGQTGEKISPLKDDFSFEVENLIKSRRSIRHYLDKPISKETVLKIIEVVNHAPTGTNSRKVAVTVVNGKEKMKLVSDLAMNFFRNLTNLLINPVTFVFIAPFIGLQRWKKLKGYKSYIGHYYKGKNILTHDAPALFIFHASNKSSCPAEDGVIWSTTAALYAESLGLGTCYNGFLVRAINKSRKLKKYLEIPKDHKVYETFTIGYPELKYKRSAYHPICDYKII